MPKNLFYRIILRYHHTLIIVITELIYQIDIISLSGFIFITCNSLFLFMRILAYIGGILFQNIFDENCFLMDFYLKFMSLAYY